MNIWSTLMFLSSHKRPPPICLPRKNWRVLFIRALDGTLWPQRVHRMEPFFIVLHPSHCNLNFILNVILMFKVFIKNHLISQTIFSYNYRVISNKEDLILISVRTQFFEYSEPCQKSRFELQRGRFHCPSDRTCWKELWFPLQDLPSFITLQIGFAIIIVLLFILSSKKQKRASSINCDCQLAILEPKI
uniref:Transmembrane protein n=1 Tax=Angiostrongylus cantonensis TaxID=6313 RepID=A0A0K0D037_ANGCA